MHVAYTHTHTPRHENTHMQTYVTVLRHMGGRLLWHADINQTTQKSYNIYKNRGMILLFL